MVSLDIYVVDIILSTRVISIDYVKSKDNIMDSLTKGLKQRASRKIIEMNKSKAHRMKGLPYKGKPNLANWKSQELGSKEQPNCKITC